MISTAEIKDPQHLLIDRCKEGDNQAFKQIYQLYAKVMFNICMRIINDIREAEDALQNSFVAAFSHIKEYDAGKATFGAWLKRIVINQSIDALKKRKLIFLPMDNLEAKEEDQEEETLVYSVETLTRGIEQLPDGYRVILILYLFEEYPHKKIAEKLKISESTSKSQFFRARKKLIEYLTKNTHA